MSHWGQNPVGRDMSAYACACGKLEGMDAVKKKGGFLSGLFGGKKKGAGPPMVGRLPAKEEVESDDDDSDEQPQGRGGEERLDVGADVQIHSLTGSTEHNGSRGQLVRFDEDTGRWDVCITIGQRGRVLALKPANLYRVMAKESWAAAGESTMAAPGDDNRLEIGALVQVHSLSAAPEHNGVHGVLELLDTPTGRWQVKTLAKTGGHSKTLALKPANLMWMVSAADVDRSKAWRPPKGDERLNP